MWEKSHFHYYFLFCSRDGKFPFCSRGGKFLFCRRDGRLGQCLWFADCWQLLLPPASLLPVWLILWLSVTGACLGPTVTLGANLGLAALTTRPPWTTWFQPGPRLSCSVDGSARFAFGGLRSSRLIISSLIYLIFCSRDLFSISSFVRMY
jgi:hypothetical protein